MRVISGSARGHKLLTPEGLSTRPTLDRIKETLFNIIAFDLPDCVFLDLFSGSGGIGIEALSRGAKQVVFVDFAKESKAVIEKNLEATHLSDRAKLYNEDVIGVIKKLGEEKCKFDIIFMDPPYNNGLIDKCLEQINKSKILNEQGYIIAEHETGEKIVIPQGINIIREKVYTKTTMTFMEEMR